MTNPFPGIDPYLEHPTWWPGFHAPFLTECWRQLNTRLPSHYAATLEVHLNVTSELGNGIQLMRPDLQVADRRNRPVRASNPSTVATLEPQTIPVHVLDEEEQKYVRILRVPEMTLVTVIELLSPSNKGSGRHEYLSKRQALLRQPVHIVELDFLLGGQRLPMQKALPAADYYAIVARSERRPDAEVYSWTVRDKLPTIPIPLSAPDPDMPLDLAAAFQTTYEIGRFAMLLRHKDPPPIPADVPESTRKWIATQALKRSRKTKGTT